MPNLRRLLKYVPATSSAFFSHQNISKNTYFQITKLKMVVKFHFMCTLNVISFPAIVSVFIITPFSLPDRENMSFSSVFLF